MTDAHLDILRKGEPMLEQTTETRTIASLIDAALERVEEVNVRAIAELVVQDLTEEEARRYATIGIQERVRGQLGHHRHGRQEHPEGSARWEEVKSSAASGELDLERVAIWTGARHKWVLDCSLSDLIDAKDEHVQQATGHEQSAERLSKLAALLRRTKGAEVVGDLPPDRVRKILNA